MAGCSLSPSNPFEWFDLSRYRSVRGFTARLPAVTQFDHKGLSSASCKMHRNAGGKQNKTRGAVTGSGVDGSRKPASSQPRQKQKKGRSLFARPTCRVSGTTPSLPQASSGCEERFAEPTAAGPSRKRLEARALRWPRVCTVGAAGVPYEICIHRVWNDEATRPPFFGEHSGPLGGEVYEQRLEGKMKYVGSM